MRYFTEETERTNLYFSNPFWLQWLLQNAGKKDGGQKELARRRSNVEPLRPELDGRKMHLKADPAERTDTAEERADHQGSHGRRICQLRRLEEVKKKPVASAPEEVFAIERVVVEAEEPVIAGTAPWEEE